MAKNAIAAVAAIEQRSVLRPELAVGIISYTNHASMSVDIDWQTLTEGPDGAALAETIRAFVHERFQHVTLPKLIRSVKCHAFEFGTIPPQIVLKDICDPLPDFYEDDDNGDAIEDDNEPVANLEKVTEHVRGPTVHTRDDGPPRQSSKVDPLGHNESPSLARGATPGMLGGTSNLGYFHMPLSAGLSGTATPLAAVAGARFRNGPAPPSEEHHHAESFSSISPASSATDPSRPTSRDASSYFDHRGASAAVSDGSGTESPPAGDRDHELSLTAEVFLDYPMPSFVGIPLKLNITGLTFDGVGIMAYIKKRAHLCFLAPEDADALVGGDGSVVCPDAGTTDTADSRPSKVGGLLEDIKIESEMGETDSGKQVLKNMGKIEKFILEQVQRIFEDEFVYPSYWTFLCDTAGRQLQCGFHPRMQPGEGGAPGTKAPANALRAAAPARTSFAAVDGRREGGWL
ncbi:hypothetical protein EJ03DRAFT_338550 [Teratosphaeria nubilosa]|uniref:Mitochondrial distribution and morphology protein 12 n=1 Tax=Teratosphaeria nubilosa TaxID=161662 RepID=A0A6G1L1S3_9PEZI|nr:hypothetical protein EJ03DRAFT_338550 [Teratosphaeria nubilosa]